MTHEEHMGEVRRLVSEVLMQRNKLAKSMSELENAVEELDCEPVFPDGYEEIHELLPPSEKLSVGAMEDLKQSLREWRKRNGY